MTVLPEAGRPLPLLRLVALIVLAHAAFTGARVALVLRTMELGGTAAQAGLVASMLALLMLEAGLLLALLPALAALCAAAVLLGCGFMFAHLAVSQAVGQGGTAGGRTHAYSMLALGVSTSTMAGPVLAGFLLDGIGHGWTFAVLAALPLLALGLVGNLKRRCAAPAGRVTHKPRVMDLLRHAPLRAVFIVGALLSMGWDLFTFMIPMHGQRIGLPASTIGLVMGAFGAGTFLVRLCIGFLARRLAEWRLLAGALAASALVYALLPLSGSVPVLLGLAFVLGLGLGAAAPTTMSAIQLAAPPGRGGEAIGVRTMLVNASQTAMPVLFGAMGAASGTGAAFWLLAALLAAGGVYAARRRGP